MPPGYAKQLFTIDDSPGSQMRPARRSAPNRKAVKHVMNQMNQITIPLEDLFAPGTAPDARNADPIAIGIQVARRYPFLSQPISVGIVGHRVRLSYPAASDRAQAEAACLAKRAAQHAGNGECHRAIDMWQRVLQLVPDNLVARRDIGMAYSELGNFTQARKYLAEALLLDFEDAGSLVALANIAIKQEDYGTAEVYAKKAVAAGPQDAWALNCLGTVLLYTQRQDEALSLLRAAMASDPGLAPSYWAIAYLYRHQGRYSEAEATLRELFIRVRKPDIRYEPIFIQARQLYRQVQESIAESLHPEVSRTVEEFRVAVEMHAGRPIRVVEESSSDGPVARVQLAWQHGRDHHLIHCHSGYPAKLMPHLLAHAIMHVRMGHDAHQAGRCRFYSLSPADRMAALEAFENQLERLVDEGFPLPWIADCVGRLVANLFGALFNYPLDLVVEKKLQ